MRTPAFPPENMIDSRDTQASRGIAEFDRFAKHYDAGMDDPVKRLLGPNIELYAEMKMRWMCRDINRSRRLAHRDLRLLDYGCGNGVLLNILRKNGFPGVVMGCDVSESMLREAVRIWDCGPVPSLSLLDGDSIPYADATFDVVVASGVFHHVTREKQRIRIFSEVHRILKPVGIFYVFEHNPTNPVTRWIVSRAEIDRNAHLLRASRVRREMLTAGLVDELTEYLMFLPPRWRCLWPVEDWIRWFPFGGQYAVRSRRFEEV